MRRNNKQAGFSAVELLITLFIAAAFLISGYQLYGVVTKDGGGMRRQSRANNLANDYLEQYKALTTDPCTIPGNLPNNSTLTPQPTGLVNVDLTVAITCPYISSEPSTSTNSISKVTVTLKYSNPQETVIVAGYVGSPGCKTGFILVPGSATYATSDFCVMKYEAKNVGGIATSQASGAPWSTTRANSIDKSISVCTGCSLISERQWLTIAQNVLSVPSNWNSNTVSSGFIYSGHNDSAPSSAQEASTNDADGYTNTGNVGPSNQRRTLKLTNGEIIWDFAGNINEWTSGELTNIYQPGVYGGGVAWREWKTITSLDPAMDPNPLPIVTRIIYADMWTHLNGIGRVYSGVDGPRTNTGFVRGGGSTSSANAGVLSLEFQPYSGNFGFRVAR